MVSLGQKVSGMWILWLSRLVFYCGCTVFCFVPLISHCIMLWSGVIIRKLGLNCSEAFLLEL